MIRKTQLFWIVLLLLSLCSCGKSSNNMELSNPPSQQAGEEKEPAKDIDIISSKSERFGFYEPINNTYSIGGIDFSIPSYFDTEAVEENEVYLYVGSEKSIVMLILRNDNDVPIDLQEIQEMQEMQETDDDLLNSLIANSMGPSDNYDVELIDSKIAVIAGLPSVTVRLSADISIDRDKGIVLPVHIIYSLAIDAENNKIVSIILVQADGSTYSYFSDYEKIIESATISQTPATSLPELEPNPEVEPEPEPDPAPSDGIRPEFKQAMDSYEEFFDKYIAFMKKFQTSDNTFEMLTDYLNFMNQYMETMESLENMDTDDLSSAELLYYTEVMLRINQKLYSVIS